ncbi:MAG: glycosyltransferase family 4 protein [Candidatus Auribacterota bacterium]|jgi:glycosyltransferase involved in cell wall biosynthesis|nr:glycosyltransferase family 4 protein [Candidatus Auribacterota bacterium]
MSYAKASRHLPENRRVISSKTIDIAFIGYFFDMGGVQKSCLTIAEHLKDRGFSFHMINLKNTFFQERFKACGVCRSITEPRDVIRYLQENNIDIVHVNNCDSGSYFAHCAGITHIVERLDGYASAFIFDKTPVDCIVASTDAVYERALKEYPHKYVDLIYNGVDTSLFQPRRTCATPLRDRLGIRESDIVVGYLGRISREKRQDKLIELFARTLQSNPGLKLILMGNDHQDGYRELLAEKISDMSLHKSVFLMEGTEHPEHVIPEFDIGVIFTGTYTKPDGSVHIPREGYPNAVMETMSTGIPVVATNCGEIPLLVQHGKTGFVFDVNDETGFKDALIELSNNKRLRKEMGENARKYVVNHFAIESMVNRYEKLYRRILDPDFSIKYPKSRHGTDKYFMTKNFDITNVQSKNKTLVIRSGSKPMADILVDRLRESGVEKISFLCTEKNYADIRKYEIHDEIFVYCYSDRFDPERMGCIISEINDRHYDYIFFILNNYNGLRMESAERFYESLKSFKASKNIFDLCDSLSADKKIAVTACGSMFEW